VRSLGRHLIAELYSCRSDLIDDEAIVRRHMLEAARRIGATVVGEVFHRFSPHGVSGTVVIEESHLSIHTWPEHRYVAVDLFTCGGLDPRPGFLYLKQALGAADARMQEIARGLPEELEEGDPALPKDVRLFTRLARLG
jgi:S-adenosylmethionine decarboxylase proenzyme